MTIDLSGKSLLDPSQLLALDAAAAAASRLERWPIQYAFGRPLGAQEIPANWPGEVLAWLERTPPGARFPDSDWRFLRRAFGDAVSARRTTEALAALSSLTVGLSSRQGNDQEAVRAWALEFQPSPLEQLRYAFVLGRLGQAGLVTEPVLDRLGEWLESADENEIPQGQDGTIWLSTQTALLDYATAFGIGSQGPARASKEAIAALRRILVRASGHQLTEAYRGLANQIPFPCDAPASEQAREIRSRLDAWRRDASQRRIEARVLAAGLQGCPPSRRATTLATLRRMWTVEREPELRRELALILLAGASGNLPM